MPLRDRQRRPKSPQRLLVGLGITFTLGLAGLFAVWFWPEGGQGPLHPHQAAPHGGTLISLGAGNRHYHVELLRTRQGVLLMHTLSDESTQVQEVETQRLRAHLQAQDGKPVVALTLLPLPQRGDAPGKTSRFVAQVRGAGSQSPLVLRVEGLLIEGQRFNFDWPFQTGAAAEEVTALTPGGKYTPADVTANGSVSADEKYRGLQPDHELRPRQGQLVCPITLARVSQRFRWQVAGQVYLFCCPLCIDHFLRVAREQPEQIKSPAEYVLQ